MSKELGELVVKTCKPEEFMDCDLVFSGLDSDVAGEVGTSMINSVSSETAGIFVDDS